MRTDVAAWLKIISAMESEGHVLHTDAVYDKGWIHFHDLIENAFPRSSVSDQKRQSLLGNAVRQYTAAIDNCSAEVLGLDCPRKYHLSQHIQPMLMRIINRNASAAEIYQSHLDMLSTFHSIRAKEPIRFFGISGMQGERALRVKFRPDQRVALEQALAEYDTLPEASRGMVVQISVQTSKMIDRMLECLIENDGLQ
jgi:hemoglobin-like flavoprotein